MTNVRALDAISTLTRSSAVFGPAATTWFTFLQRKVKIAGSPNLEIIARVGLDQCLFASTNLFVFLSSMALMEGTDPQKKLESTYWTALQKNWMLWPVIQLTNFKFVPLDQRVLVVNVISLGTRMLHVLHVLPQYTDFISGWNCYLSFLNTQGGSSDKSDGGVMPPDA